MRHSLATRAVSCVVILGSMASCSAADEPPRVSGWRSAENRAIMNSIEHVVRSSQLSNLGAARLYAYTLVAATEARREVGEGAAIVAASHVLTRMLPLSSSLLQTSLPGLSARASSTSSDSHLAAVSIAEEWLAVAWADGAEALLSDLGSSNSLSGDNPAIDAAALKRRLGLPPEGLDRSQSIVDQLQRMQALELALLDTELLVWEPTPAGYLLAKSPNWGTLAPIGLDSDAIQACRVDAPDPMRVLEEASDLLLEYDLADSANWQVTVWLGSRGTVTPSGIWVRMGFDAAEKAGKDGLEVAASVATATHNANIAGWSEKFRHNLVRPETLWSRLLGSPEGTLRDTPAHPAYPSGHSVVSAAAAYVIERKLGEDTPLELIVPGTLGFETRPVEFPTAADALQSVSESRVMARFHYPMDTDAGKTIGECAAILTLREGGIG